MKKQRIRISFLNVLALIYLLPELVQSTCDYTICECQNSICTSCLSSQFYYTPSPQSCKLCPYECKSCNSNQQCLTCRPMYYLLNKQCYPCQKYCKTCALSTCSQCIDGYVLISGACQKCQISNVQTCQSLMTVAMCIDGYWRNGDSCSSCRQFCSFCTSANNCLKCQDGYRTKVSAGTYCVACDTGCKTCTQTSCSECFYNYRLVNSSCVSIKSLCSLIQYCQSCQFSNNTAKCILCTYPYYISSNGTCVQGSSILCKYSNQKNPYQCLNECSQLAYPSQSILSTSNNINQLICLPRLWIESTVMEQVYFNALYIQKYKTTFTSNQSYLSLCSSQYIYSSQFKNGINSIKITNIFQPYYKLVFYIKFLPVYKSQFPNLMGLTLNIKMSDNSTNTYTYQQSYLGTELTSCIQNYLTISSKNIKDQSVSISLESSLTNSTYTTDSQYASTFPNGLVGYRQILIQIYRCDSKCRICSNSKYCLQCYGNLFLSSHKCVDNCQGLFQFYLPNGNYLNFNSKYCLQQCYKGYYSTLHPIKNTTFICLKCPANCETCKSDTQCLSCVKPYLLYSTNFSCILSCPNTHYSSNVKLQCLPCNAPCKTCSNQTQCLSCYIGYFDGNGCVGICPQGTYSSASVKLCLPCDSKCSVCQNSPTFCSKCQTPYKLLGNSCLQTCPSNTHYQYNGLCLPCKSPCTLCSSQTTCLTCSRGYLFNQGCLSQCPSGYYKDIGNSRCNLCENNCKTCLSPSICRSCINGTYLYNSMCLAQCPLKTYISPSAICIPCIPPCLTCSNQTSCITCSLGYLSLLSPFTCTPSCQDGYFGQSSNQTCIKCSSSCKTCNQQASFCISCPPNLLLQSNTCVPTCSLNYFNFNNQKCRPCSYPCLTCVDISSKCLTCHSPYILSGENKCSLQCLSSQYKKNGTCLNCVPPCEACTEINVCTTCARSPSLANQTYLIYNNCLAYCPDGMYADSISLKCKTCIFPCLNCLSSRQCLSCVSGYLNKLKQSCEVCSSSYYPDQPTKSCILCNFSLPHCQQCQSSSICKVCSPNYYLLNSLISTCVSLAQCQNKSSYYLNDKIKKCSQCVPPCNSCLNSSFCLSCLNGYLYQGKCIFSCVDGWYANQTSKLCLNCNASICRTCANDPNQCASCFVNAESNVFFSQNKTCIKSTECADSYYLDSLYGYLRCLRCISPCRTCVNASFCSSCVTGVLYKGSCSFSCPNKYYAQQLNNSTSSTSPTSTSPTCQQCSPTCLQCTSQSSNCISCPVTKYLQSNQCVTQCSVGYYLSQYNLECMKCQSPCQQCQSVTYCINCDNSSKILYYGQCVDSCPEGTYYNSTQIECLACPSTCQLCKSNTNSSTNSSNNFHPVVICTKCISSLYMNSTNEGSCQKTCKLNQYPDDQTRKCYQCQVPCDQCKTATKCKTCISGYFIYSNGQCLKGSECSKGTYLDPLTGKSCLDQCLAPYYGDDLIKKCSLQCSSNYLKVPIQSNRVCSQTCPSNYFVDNNFICSQCSQSICNNILSYEIFAKSIFNKLYVKIKFSKEVLTNFIDNSSVQIIITELQVASLSTIDSRRRLAEIKGIQKYQFQVMERTSRSVWLQLKTYKTLSKISLKIHFSSYYILSPISSSPSPQSNLQVLNSSILISRFDQYTVEQQESGKSYEAFSMFLSILILVIIIISLIGNFLSLFYSLIDYFQILFLLSFLQIDYPPGLNYFLYGFRYSHYLFLPQIFRPADNNSQEYSETPGKFGIIVPDADFLSNTGHDFLIIFVVIGFVILVKLIDFLLSGKIKNNKVSNDPEYSQHKISQKSPSDQIESQLSPKNLQQINFQRRSELNTHNLIQIQILQGKHGKLVKYTKIFISRLKWNYLNDVSYCLYFYIALFSYSQTYILTEAKFMSNLFAFIGFGFTLGLPIFYIYLLRKNSYDIESQGLQRKIYLPFKTFYYFTIPDSSFALYSIPIKYIRKLLIAVLLVYCSEFPQFVLGIILMFTLLNIIMMYLYKPFLLTFELYIQIAIDFLFMITILCLCLMQLDSLSFQTDQKLLLSKTVVGITILLTLILIIWNIIRLVVQLIKEFCNKDYFQNWYRQLQDKSEKSTKTGRKKSQMSIYNDKQIDDQHEQSKVRLHEDALSPGLNRNQISSLNRNSEDQYSALDIYLKKQHDAPPMLIKCIKDFSDEDKSDQSQSSQSEQKQSNHQTHARKQINKAKHANNNNKQYIQNQFEQSDPTITSKDMSSNIFSEERDQQVESNQQQSEKMHTTQSNLKVINRNKHVDQFSNEPSSQQIGSIQQKQSEHSEHSEHSDHSDHSDHSNHSGNLGHSSPQKSEDKKSQHQYQGQQNIQITYSPNKNVGQIFSIVRDQNRNKMKTILQVQDFDVGESQSPSTNKISFHQFHQAQDESKNQLQISEIQNKTNKKKNSNDIHSVSEEDQSQSRKQI